MLKSNICSKLSLFIGRVALRPTLDAFILLGVDVGINVCHINFWQVSLSVVAHFDGTADGKCSLRYWVAAKDETLFKIYL